jgi:hypothetical protein
VWLWAWINHSCPTLFSTATCFLLKSSEKNHSIYAFFLPSYIGFLLNSKDPLSIQITTLVYAKQWFWYLFFFLGFQLSCLHRKQIRDLSSFPCFIRSCLDLLQSLYFC